MSANQEISIDPRLRNNTPSNAIQQQPPIATHQVRTAVLATKSGSNSTSPITLLPQYNPSQQTQFLPHSPQACENPADQEHGSQGNNDGSDPKRPRACEACRGLKVRCEPDPNNSNPNGPCKRCAKAGRDCIITAPSRKRQRKTDSRVAELEKKINALQASLSASKNGPAITLHGNDNGYAPEGMNTQARHNSYQQVTNGGYNNQYGGAQETRGEIRGEEYAGYLLKPSTPSMVVAGQKRKLSDSRNSSINTASPMSGGNIHAPKSSHEKIEFLVGPGTKPTPNHDYSDVIDRGLLTADMAVKMFECYVKKMTPHMPAVVFPAETTAAEVRKNAPTLFLAILSAASGSNYPELQRTLTKEVMSIYAERVICNGEKTLELVQSLHISTLWYWPPEHFEELKFYQLIHVAAVMGIDIGLGKRSKAARAKPAGLWRDNPWRRTPYPDPESIEARRAWLVCYFLCCNASMGLRRPNLIRWTSFMADSVQVLETSPAAAPSDKALCQWVRSQHIAEDIGFQFEMDDPEATVNIADNKVQNSLRGFEKELHDWSINIPQEARSLTLTMTEHVVNLYMHEVALHVDHSVEEFKPPFTEETFREIDEQAGSKMKLSPERIKGLSICLDAIDGVFESFLAFDVETVRCLPVANFVRVAYAVVVLIKMYFAATVPDSELGEVFVKENIKVEKYLDGLVELFKAAAAEERSRPSAKFLMVLLMLKTWFHRQRKGTPVGTRPNQTATHTPSDTNQQQRTGSQSSYNTANASLQLLSEVATGTPNAHSGSGPPNYMGSEWQPSQFPVQSFPSSMSQPGPQGYENINMGNDFSINGMELSYSMGDGFEQAMGMALGAGDFGSLYGDGFLNNFEGFN